MEISLENLCVDIGAYIGGRSNFSAKALKTLKTQGNISVEKNNLKYIRFIRINLTFNSFRMEKLRRI